MSAAASASDSCSNPASLLDPNARRSKYRAQWNDDFHHAWHVLLTGETSGYYRDYADPRRHIARTLASGFAYQGEPSAHRGGRRRGEPSGRLPPTAFVSFLQNHDQIGNRPRGERLVALAPAQAIEAALAVMLLAPMPPLMFMGEEWGANEPFPFFCDFSGALADPVRKGRRAEFKEAYLHQKQESEIPDPLAGATFRSAVLDWTAREEPGHRRRLDLVTRLLAARRAHVAPRLAGLAHGAAQAAWAETVLTASWRLNGGVLALIANISDADARRPDMRLGALIWGGAVGDPLPPWSVHWAWEDG